MEEPKHNRGEICHTNPEPISPPPLKEDYHPKEIITPVIKSKVHTMKTYVLELNEEEAIWLRGVMQNSLHGQSPTEEPAEDRKMRQAFFGAVESAGGHNE